MTKAGNIMEVRERMDAFSGLCPVGSPLCQEVEEEKEKSDDAENWCAARVAYASRRALKHQDTWWDFNHFFYPEPGARFTWTRTGREG